MYNASCNENNKWQMEPDDTIQVVPMNKKSAEVSDGLDDMKEVCFPSLTQTLGVVVVLIVWSLCVAGARARASAAGLLYGGGGGQVKRPHPVIHTTIISVVQFLFCKVM